MPLPKFIQVYEQAKRNFPAERAVLPFRTPFTEGHTFFGTIVGLRQDWKDPDPGKYQPHWFFVRDYATRSSPFNGRVTELAWCDRFWVKEILDDAKAAEAGNPFWCGYPQNAPLPVPLGTFADAKREACPCCGTDAFVVGCYERGNSVEYGQWDITVSVLCLDCSTVTRRFSRSETRRSLESLERPAAS